jgi:hypothetical protein
MLPARATVRVLGATFATSMLVALACHVPPWERPTAYRCQPSSPDPDERCPEREQCCSDDPAALDLLELDGPALPAYEGRLGSGTPLFSDDRNDAGFSGLCVEVGSIAPAFALPSGCPVPCNPSWDSDSIDAVCGAGSFCCQTLEVDASDCVLDPGIGDDGCWRPARGDDIMGLGGLDATSWSADELATPQDPGGQQCEAFVTGLSEEQLDDAGVTADDVRLACLRRLGVANQRGFCIGGPGVIGCPLAQPTHRDACEQLNDGEGRDGCG